MKINYQVKAVHPLLQVRGFFIFMYSNITERVTAFTEKMLNLSKSRAKLSTDAYCLATDIYLAWLKQDCPQRLYISFNLACEYGYDGTEKTFIKSFKSLNELNIFDTQDEHRHFRFIVFN